MIVIDHHDTLHQLTSENIETHPLSAGVSVILPDVLHEKGNEVSICFLTGYLSPEEIPYPLKMAILMLATHWYEQREPISQELKHKVPYAYDYLIHPYRVKRLV